MIRRYTCPVCGYPKAVWKLELSCSSLVYCENCYSRYKWKHAHISDFNLNNINYRRLSHGY